MTASIIKLYRDDCSLLGAGLANNEIEKKQSEAVQRLRGLPDHPAAASIDGKRRKALLHAMDFRTTAAAISRSLYFRVSKPLALISGAGIAGLAAAFELRARGFNVVIAEKRKIFSRFNIINLSVETQAFLTKFNLLEKFEKSIASRIQEHRYVLIKKNKSAERLAVSDVRDLRLDKSTSFEPKNFNKLFDQDGIYSVAIGVLQTFLAENALEAGVNIFGDATVRILSRTREGGIAKAQITADRTLQPDLFFIAEGAHPATARQLGIGTRKVANACAGESWIFGNMTYSGRETFVVSLVDASEKKLRLANVIFNAKSQAINIAVTSDQEVREAAIREQILRTAHQVFDQRVFPLEEIQSKLLTTVSKPVHVANRTSFPFSVGNVFCIGDAAGSSSPLAGLGGTLGTALVPLAVGRLADGYQTQSGDMHENFHAFSEAYTSRWIQKSENIKKFCISIFEKEKSQS